LLTNLGPDPTLGADGAMNVDPGLADAPDAAGDAGAPDGAGPDGAGPDGAGPDSAAPDGAASDGAASADDAPTNGAASGAASADAVATNGAASAAAAAAPATASEVAWLEIDRVGRAYVRWIQRALNRVASAGLAEDGIAGERTRAAIRRFQQKSGLPVNGIVGQPTEAALVRAGAAPPASSSTSSSSSGGTARSTATAPACRLDSTVGEVTLYQPIALDVAGVPNETAIYLPPGLRRSAQVDLIVYFHGFERNRAGHIVCGRARNIAEYLRDRQFALREPLRDSGKSAILVVPKLGPQSQSGRLAKAGAFTAFIDQVLAALASCGAWSSPPSLGRLILAGHSGGGAPVGRIAALQGELVDHLKEVWMFDALYGQVDAWKRFLGQHPDVVARFVYTNGGGTRANHVALEGAARGSNVEIRLTRAAGHCTVPRDEIAGFLTQSVLANR
jgi:peptidoglycan hydrolase-like protein with peptidoglycan-binding domain